MVYPIAFFVRRRVPNRVLIPNVLGNALANFHGFGELQRKERLPAGFTGQAAQHAGLPVGIVRLEDTDSVDRGVRLLRHLQHTLERGLARVVAAVADHNQNFLFEGAASQTYQSVNNRVIECRRANRWSARDGGCQLFDAIAEAHALRQALRYRLIEIHDKNLIPGIARTDKGARAGGHLIQLLSHAAAVVDHQADGNGRVIMPEQTDRLRPAIFEYVEVLALKPGDRVTRMIAYGGTQHY